MNKFKFSVLSILLVLVFLISGCTRAQSASLLNCYSIFDQTVAEYGVKDNKVVVFDEEGRINLFSADSYSTALYNAISQIAEGGSLNVLNMLSDGGEYQTLIHGVSEIFFERRIDNPQRDVKQETITKFYESLDGLDKIVKQVSTSKKAFENTFDFVDGDVTSRAMLSSLNTYLENYCELINKFFNIGVAYEALYEEVLGGDTTKEIASTENMHIKKLVLSFELYLAKYYYLKNIVLTKSYTNRFGHENIQTNGDFVENTSYDDIFAEFIEITQKDSNISEVGSGETNDAIFYYNAGLKQLERLRADVKNYEKAVQIILKNGDNSGQYQKFITDFDEDVKNYQQFIIKNYIV